MAQAGQISSPSSSLLNREESSGAASSSSSSSSSSLPVREEEESHNGGNQLQFGEADANDQRVGFLRGLFFAYEDISAIRNDTWSCVIVVLTFWFFVSMTLILGVYGPVSMMIGPNSSILIRPSPLFLQSVEVEELDSNHPGIILYGFYKTPPLNVVKSWSKSYNVTVPVDSHKEWLYYLNEGSQINISYRVNSPSSSLILVISQGNGGLSEWLEDPTYPNATLSWNFIDGSGIIQQQIQKSSSYYVAAGNLNSEDIELQLNLSISALLYNTTEAYYTCAFTNAMCKLNILFPSGNAVVLTSAGPEEESPSGEWYVKLSYGPRWATYIIGIAVATLLLLLMFNILYDLRCIREEVTGVLNGEMRPERAPLLSHKDDDLSSWGSSYDSVSNDEDDLERLLASGSLEGKPLGDGENGNNTLRLCAICFDAPRDCFFLPCGHCVTCFECGTRIVEAAGTCPVCRRNMKKVRKIFTV